MLIHGFCNQKPMVHAQTLPLESKHRHMVYWKAADIVMSATHSTPAGLGMFPWKAGQSTRLYPSDYNTSAAQAVRRSTSSCVGLVFLVPQEQFCDPPFGRWRRSQRGLRAGCGRVQVPKRKVSTQNRDCDFEYRNPTYPVCPKLPLRYPKHHLLETIYGPQWYFWTGMHPPTTKLNTILRAGSYLEG